MSYSFLENFGSPLYEGFDDHENDKDKDSKKESDSCYLKTDNDGDEQLFKVTGEACKTISKMTDNTIKVHLCDDDDKALGGSCYQEEKEEVNEDEGEKEDGDNEKEDGDNEKEDGDNEKEDGDNEKEKDDNDDEEGTDDEETDDETEGFIGGRGGEQQLIGGRGGKENIIGGRGGEQQLIGGRGGRQNMNVDTNSLESVFNVKLLLKAVLFTCLFYLLAHNDTKNVISKGLNMGKEYYLYLAAVIFFVGYLILNLIV